ncbi:MAG: twin-arginine translocation signal domain-containing protein [Roseomonas sp.]|nr:twin-arginine translocation signal domain-containing protein [Roseomonas sp.]MCA3326569.1 twin-arginine translocation signal domain-containing protein [Roseomonas sp.]MCA3331183.1 twin-arginine translocation signal domain-containing protein [Roseomonas sp.]MCA3334819.1 twin-arginine translocation signal domain-containing protein [Roseomonas sp.]MCA3347275.1 twin-arginine translocation signal domain-containing protein [Roseomonas sp.]
MSADDKQVAQRRGFLKTLGLAGGAAVAATAAEASAPLRADAVPAGTARKENQADRLKARYQANSAHVQAFYRTNRSSDT